MSSIFVNRGATFSEYVSAITKIEASWQTGRAFEGREGFWSDAEMFIRDFFLKWEGLAEIGSDNDSDGGDDGHGFFDYRQFEASSLAGYVESITSPGMITLKKSYAEANYGKHCVEMIDRLKLEAYLTAPMEMLWVRETPMGPHANAKALYSVRLLLDAAPVDVGAAVAASLLEEPKRLDEASMAELWKVPPPLAPEWTDEDGVMPASGRRELAFRTYASRTGLGLRILHVSDYVQPVEGMPPGWKGMCIVYRHRGLDPGVFFSIDNLPVKSFTFFAREEETATRAEDLGEFAPDTGLLPDRVFTIYCRETPVIAWKMLEVRQAGWIDKSIPRDLDAYIVTRVTVKAYRQGVGGKDNRTELVWELLDVTPFFHARLVPGDEHCQKGYVCLLEDEARQWSKAWGFDVVEVWRGARSSLHSQFISMSHIVASLHCLCPGDGAAAICEQETPQTFDRQVASLLASRFPNKYLRGVGGGGSSGSLNLTEGSINILSFALTLDRICKRASLSADIFRQFVDLGSGCGNAVIAAHALFPFRSCLGIELVPEFVAMSQHRAGRYIDLKITARSPSITPEEMFVEGDIFHIDWSDASVVLCNAVTWHYELLTPLFRLALRMRSGSVFMLMGLNKKMPPQPEFLEAFDFRTEACLVSWQERPCAFWVLQRI